MYFLSGLPRTGSTVLSSLLNQNPTLYVSSTSGLLDFLCETNNSYHNIIGRYKNYNVKQEENIYKSIINSWYSHVDEDIVIDKWRGWINNVDQIKSLIDPDPKIICTYRPIEEIMVSFIELLNQDKGNFIDMELRSRNLSPTNQNRSLYLLNEGVVGETLSFMESSYSEKNLYLSYDDIVLNTNKTLETIHDYLGLQSFNYSNILNNEVEDNDEYWGIKNLHTVRRDIIKTSRPPEDYFSEGFLNYLIEQNKRIEMIWN